MEDIYQLLEATEVSARTIKDLFSLSRLRAFLFTMKCIVEVGDAR